MLKALVILILAGVSSIVLSEPVSETNQNFVNKTVKNDNKASDNEINTKEIKDFSGYAEFSEFINSDEYKKFVKTKKKNKFKVGSYYMLLGNTNKLKNTDNTNLCSGNGCTLNRGSKFKVIDVSNESAKIIIIKSEPSSEGKNMENNKNINNKSKKENGTENNSNNGSKQEDELAKKGYVYTHDTKELFIRSQKFVDLEDYFDHLSLRAILVPQKFYSSTNAFSSNPTVGVGLSFSSYRSTDIKSLLSVTVGAGFNQITIDSNSGANEKTGFSYFLGYDFTDNAGLSAGIYVGWDIVDLKDGETFNGLKNETQKWIGLVLSTGF